MATVVINEERLSAIGDAIRAKTGDTALLKVADMPAAIESITTGGSGGYEIPEEAKRLTGSANSLFGDSSTLKQQQMIAYDWFIHSDGVYTENLSDGSYMFGYNRNLTDVPFDLNFQEGSSAGFGATFIECENLTKIGVIRNLKPSSCARVFYGCRRLRELPTFENFDMSSFNSTTTNMYSWFYACCSLRSIPEELLAKLWNLNISSSASGNAHSNQFYYCYAIDEITGVRPTADENKVVTSNLFYNTFYNCARVKNITFATQENGSVYVRPWSNQYINLYSDQLTAGVADSEFSMLNYNSGITTDKKVTDAASYQALKNDPDWWTMDIAYSRYNHDSAVNTINSLPDCSSGSNNIIKFNGGAGSATDGGAINTLTTEEIAVAAAKGWTVTLV